MKKRAEKELGTMAVVCINGIKWVSNQRFNGLFRCADTVEYIGRFANYEDTELNIHYGASHYNNRLYFFSYFKRYIDFYDIDKNEFGYIDLAKLGIDEYVSAGSLEWKGALYVFPKYRNMPIIRIDKEKVSVINSEYTNYLSSIRNMRNDFCTRDSNVYYLNNGDKRVINYNIETNKIEVFHFDYYIENIVNDGLFFYLLTSCGKVLKCDINFDIVVIYEAGITSDKEYVKMLYWNGILAFVPLLDTEIILYNLHTKEKYIFRDIKLNPALNGIKRYRKFSQVSLFEDKIILYPLGFKEKCEICINSKIVTKKSYLIDNEVVPYVEEDVSNIVYEDFFDLNDFLSIF